MEYLSPWQALWGELDICVSPFILQLWIIWMYIHENNQGCYSRCPVTSMCAISPLFASQLGRIQQSVSLLPGVGIISLAVFQGLLTMIFFRLVAHNLASETKRATGTPMYMAIGQCGSVLGSHLFPSIEGPRYMYDVSLLVCSAFC